jgi:hypothetical protein
MAGRAPSWAAPARPVTKTGTRVPSAEVAHSCVVSSADGSYPGTTVRRNTVGGVAGADASHRNTVPGSVKEA